MPLAYRSASRIVSLARTRPHLLPSLSTPSTQRHIHLEGFGDLVTSTANVISSIHSSSGLPWWATIPLVGVAINVVWRYPAQRYARYVLNKQVELAPLVTAWQRRHTINSMLSHKPPAVEPEEPGRGHWKNIEERSAWIRARDASRILRLTRKSRRRIYKIFGVQGWRKLPTLLSIVPLVVVSEALRRLCGAPMTWISHWSGLASTDAPAGVLLDTSGLFDQTLEQGGCLWFVDLTAMDPYHILPAICSALMAKSAWGQFSRAQIWELLGGVRKTDGMPSGLNSMKRGFLRASLVVPIIPFLAADMPSAIFLYWVTSASLNIVNETLLRKNLPTRPSKLTISRNRIHDSLYLKCPKK
ncbi:hypothetical protein E4U19_007012 [Claviceps sp. Clav32 group G5]|nr:hypothetical protein E4U19_007012 [Claviceps sp. Clav32 group G5]KAG6028005.1 hypothetical protein E4U40_001255 [Claviceps sp. LM458 group G5]KAG6042595.1 hypothetical protein E4U39_005701 [Claviceps sp. Clav50 group G5]